ncbi:hypothetical protein [Luteimonas sp. SDU82]|uniref:hypothetical protein n=1 Tax=Luteimonas sp. SDU82 TaxID=3422592 RepID=UPI003EBD37EE
MTTQRARLLFALKVLYLVAVASVVTWAVLNIDTPWSRVAELMRRPQSYVFIVAWTVMVVLLGMLWATWLKWACGLVLPARYWLPLQFIAWSGRYLPGKVGLLAGKLSVTERGAALRTVAISVAVEQLGFVVAGFAVGTTLLPLAEVRRFLPVELQPGAVGVIAKLLVLAACLGIFVGAIRLAGRLLDGRWNAEATGPTRLAGLLTCYAVPHLTVGVAFYALVTSGTEMSRELPLAYAVALLALAHVGGAVAVFAPAGIGVREGIIVAGLAGFMGLGEALLVAAWLRVLSLIADAAILVLGVGLVRRTRAAPTFRP